MFNLAESLNHSPNKYYLQKIFKGSGGPVNTLAFNGNATLLASGGDDEVVRVWELATGDEYQQLSDLNGRWGQITCLAFVYPEAATLPSEWIFFGLGRGVFLLYRRKRDTKEFVQILNKNIFAAGDSVEAFDYNPESRRLVITSHYGHVSLYNHFGGDLNHVWSKELPDYIPRAVRFHRRGVNTAIIFTLETGKITSLDIETASEVNSKVLSSAIGNVATCPISGSFLIDNMVDGFDLYPPNRTTAAQSFKVEATKKYVKQAVFGEQGSLAICGSDHGMAYVFDINLSGPPQKLSHGKRDEMIQTVEAASANGNHFIATGSSGGKFDVYLWKKSGNSRQRKTRKSKQLDILTAVNVVILFTLCLATSDKWLPLFIRHTESLGYLPPEEIYQHQEIIADLDDQTLG
ncbi:hypothetical protein HYPSUDRAFT_55206 [Hypholoma sublateritium FD-334 SS-4]|uniref:Uncharacterized protein n=1 Tax=Hypholoma sublateritium (strain FD-334 SS-4) TaxID=945553 RepID=A0A0D2ME89_HYPSF|nr:hypothetical protein HYPSUDRAFT_55206 [Hypholoma sublateritium FD-334 SS-4]